jgi:hypothetical protein
VTELLWQERVRAEYDRVKYLQQYEELRTSNPDISAAAKVFADRACGRLDVLDALNAHLQRESQPPPRDEQERDYGAHMYQRGRSEMREEISAEAGRPTAPALKPLEEQICPVCNARFKAAPLQGEQAADLADAARILVLDVNACLPKSIHAVIEAAKRHLLAAERAGIEKGREEILSEFEALDNAAVAGICASLRAAARKETP